MFYKMTQQVVVQKCMPSLGDLDPSYNRSMDTSAAAENLQEHTLTFDRNESMNTSIDC